MHSHVTGARTCTHVYTLTSVFVSRRSVGQAPSADCAYMSLCTLAADTGRGETDVLSHINMHGHAGPIPTRSIGIINCTLGGLVSKLGHRTALVRAKTQITHLCSVERAFADFGHLYVNTFTNLQWKRYCLSHFHER